MNNIPAYSSTHTYRSIPTSITEGFDNLEPLSAHSLLDEVGKNGEASPKTRLELDALSKEALDQVAEEVMNQILDMAERSDDDMMMALTMLNSLPSKIRSLVEEKLKDKNPDFLEKRNNIGILQEAKTKGLPDVSLFKTPLEDIKKKLKEKHDNQHT
jgi:hypothetical protein